MADNTLQLVRLEAGEVELRRDWESLEELLLAVRDRGAGIAPSERERIFQMFQRGTDTGTRRGTGLGLAVCRAIAEAHGSVLRVRARGHGGSSFELCLPLPDAPTLAEPAPESTSS
ncbi:sensor histidine kinase [Sphaerotilus sp.]|uniref:sensor histidine kinase n=1 Tax=Sphaerotilus sp. TaxID=2093942 RepID=UPI0025F14C1E|nr:ATP-binding protein [Sphaerotilus sp.]